MDLVNKTRVQKAINYYTGKETKRMTVFRDLMNEVVAIENQTLGAMVRMNSAYGNSAESSLAKDYAIKAFVVKVDGVKDTLKKFEERASFEGLSEDIKNEYILEAKQGVERFKTLAQEAALVPEGIPDEAIGDIHAIARMAKIDCETIEGYIHKFERAAILKAPILSQFPNKAAFNNLYISSEKRKRFAEIVFDAKKASEVNGMSEMEILKERNVDITTFEKTADQVHFTMEMIQKLSILCGFGILEWKKRVEKLDDSVKICKY